MVMQLDLCMQGWRQMKRYTWNGVSLFVSWFFIRIVLFLWFFKHEWDHRHEIRDLCWSAIALVTIVPPLLFGLNVFWFTKILRGMLKLMSGQIHTVGVPSQVVSMLQSCSWCLLAVMLA